MVRRTGDVILAGRLKVNKGAVLSGLVGLVGGMHMKIGGEIFQTDPGWGLLIFGIGAGLFVVACLLIPFLVKGERK